MTAAPRPDPAAAVDLAENVYGLRCAAQPLPGEYDDNYALRCADGRRFVLKRMHPGADAGVVELQCAALERLAETAAELALPRVVRTSNGQAYRTVEDEDGRERLVWLLTYLPGRVLALTRHRPESLLEGLGAYVGRLDRGLVGFEHPAARRQLKWDLSRPQWAREALDAVEDPARQALARRAFDEFSAAVAPHLGSLRRSVIHNDANDHNVLVSRAPGEDPALAGLLDFGDMLAAPTVCEPAIAAAYALLDHDRPLAAAAALVRGYHAAHPLQAEEIALLFPLIRTRLAVSVVNSALRKKEISDDPYVTVSEQPAWAALERLDSVHPRLAHFTLRAACGLEADPASSAVVDVLRHHREEIGPLLESGGSPPSFHVVDLGAGSALLGPTRLPLRPIECSGC